MHCPLWFIRPGHFAWILFGNIKMKINNGLGNMLFIENKRVFYFYRNNPQHVPCLKTITCFISYSFDFDFHQSVTYTFFSLYLFPKEHAQNFVYINT